MQQPVVIRTFVDQDEADVIALWQRCNLVVPWNDPKRDIARKREHQPELFLVGHCQGQLIASVMAGYEGHRGWLYYLAVDPEFRRHNIGREMVVEAEKRLEQLGCPKVNLMVRTSNRDVVDFYQTLGYTGQEVVVLGKRLIAD